mgnify:CR=1 FL=1
MLELLLHAILQVVLFRITIKYQHVGDEERTITKYCPITEDNIDFKDGNGDRFSKSVGYYAAYKQAIQRMERWEINVLWLIISHIYELFYKNVQNQKSRSTISSRWIANRIHRVRRLQFRFDFTVYGFHTNILRKDEAKYWVQNLKTLRIRISSYIHP